MDLYNEITIKNPTKGNQRAKLKALTNYEVNRSFKEEIEEAEAWEAWYYARFGSDLFDSEWMDDELKI